MFTTGSNMTEQYILPHNMFSYSVWISEKAKRLFPSTA